MGKLSNNGSERSSFVSGTSFTSILFESCAIDNILPEDEALKIFQAFPDKSTMMLKKSLRENKYVAAQMDDAHPFSKKSSMHFRNPEF